LPFPPVTDPAAPPLRTERHIPNSIATMRRRLIIALAQHLSLGRQFALPPAPAILPRPSLAKPRQQLAHGSAHPLAHAARGLDTASVESRGDASQRRYARRP
jgi:hypothetical protein